MNTNEHHACCDHTHEHHEGCNHAHHHHDEGCDHTHHHHDCSCGCHAEELTEGEKAFLQKFADTSCLPLVRFVLASTKSAHFEAIALAPVYLESTEDEMAQVKAVGQILLGLEEKGMITLDYDEPLAGYGYERYSNSALYRYFEETLVQAKDSPEFLYDIGRLEHGSMALTVDGQAAIETI